jgi:Tol biopolymer transport system component/tRNA A-37 threonylcarbamoyl transferase component Bud32
MSGTERLSAALAGRYKIEKQLGQGGMATVYLAKDIKHDRMVAVKVLKPELAAVLGAERFVVEIKTTAALQHPHILPLFDSGTADEFLYYVMPYIEGETLRGKLDRETQFSVDEAVRITTQVADALDYAHRHGVIHRDIKPENILLHDGRPMVADFGIALAVSAAAGGRMTETGLSLGTPHYMSPEQATAEKEITGRSDIYSLASVLYEMLAGQPPHMGGSAQQIIMKIIAESAQPVTAMRKSVPPNVAAALAKALEKLPADRFETAKAFGEALVNRTFTSAVAGVVPVSGLRSSVSSLPFVVVASVAAALALYVLVDLTGRRNAAATDPAVVRFALSDDPALKIQSAYTRAFAVSPDGRTIAFSATDSAGPRLWIRNIGETRARPIPGGEDGGNAAFSPNGEWIAFVAGQSEIKKVKVTGGAVTSVTRFDARTAAMTWSSNDEILFEQIGPSGPIMRVSASGGRAEPAIFIDSASGEGGMRRPLALRDAGLVVYGSYSRIGEEEPTLVLYRTSDRRRVRLEVPGIGALALIDDRLIYSRVDGTLMALRLDVRGMRVIGEPVPLEPRVTAFSTGSAVGLSEGGTLVYRPSDATTVARLDLVDTAGRGRSLPGEFSAQGFVRFSPDGRRVALGLGSTGVRTGRPDARPQYDLWVVDAMTGEPTRVTSDGIASAPAWSADGQRLLYTAVKGPRSEIWSAAVDGSGSAKLADLEGNVMFSAAHPDGKSVLVTESSAKGEGISLVRAWIDGSARAETLYVERRHGGVRPLWPRISPDGRFVVYVDYSSSAVYVRSLTGSSVMQVSLLPTNRNPVVWGKDSRSLYYVIPMGLVAIDLETTPTLRVAGRRIIRGFPVSDNYDLHPNGRTFILASAVKASADLIVAVNWAQEARRAWRAAEKR